MDVQRRWWTLLVIQSHDHSPQQGLLLCTARMRSPTTCIDYYSRWMKKQGFKQQTYVGVTPREALAKRNSIFFRGYHLFSRHE